MLRRARSRARAFRRAAALEAAWLAVVLGVALGVVRRPARPVLRLGLVLVLVAFVTSGGRSVLDRATTGELAEQAPMSMLDDWAEGRSLTLAPATSKPAAAPSSLAKQGRLGPREMFAFAPWWSLDRVDSLQIKGLTTVAYFGVDVAANGSLIRGGNGWVGYQSQALADMITRAHKNGTRVVLTAKSFEGDVLRGLAADPKAGERLGRELAWAVKAKNLDGVNLDFEGFGDALRARFTAFIANVARTLHEADQRLQVTVDTYASSAQIDDGFFDVAGIARAVDALFVMGYDMYRSGIASPNAPLPQYERSIAAYVKLAPAAKIIYGTPFYGYDWPTRDNRPHSQATGSSTPMTYSEILAAGHPRYWDPVASVPWTAYKAGNQWHEIYYDDPSSLALKAQLADRYKLRGVGAWALRMDVNDRSLIGALTGAVSSIVLGPAGPALHTPGTATTTSAPRTKPSSTPTTKPKPKSSPTPSPSPSPSESSVPLPTPIPTIG